MPRETKEIITPSGLKVLVKTWISAGEANIVKQEMLKTMKIDPSTGKQTSEITGDFLISQEKTLLGLLVVSVNGETETVVDKLLESRNEDYQFVISEVNKIYSGNLTPEK